MTSDAQLGEWVLDLDRDDPSRGVLQPADLGEDPPGSWRGGKAADRRIDDPNLRGEDVVVDANVPLARLVPAGVDRRGLPTRARVVLYRRPLEARARDGSDMADLLHVVLVEQIAAYLRLSPDVIEGH